MPIARTAAVALVAASAMLVALAAPFTWGGAPQDGQRPAGESGGESDAARPQPSGDPAVARRGEPYTLATCPVSGQALGSMGDPVVQTFDGREIRFCCQGCVAPFEKDRAKYVAAIDKQLVAQQLPYYPLETCVVMGDSLLEDGKSIAVDVIVGNRLVRLCCRKCLGKLEREPKAYLERLDEAIVRKQLDAYPLESCAVDGTKLGSKGEPINVVLGTRLVRLCCAACRKDLEREPAVCLARIDVAWEKGRKAAPPAE